MLISYCVPCHDRVGDLAQSWPTVQEAAKQSPPIELVLVDYANKAPLPDATVVYRGRPNFHMAHARNLSIRAATGDYVMIGSADFLLDRMLFAHLRERISETGATWLRPKGYLGAIVCRRDVLIAIGGYDERFEFYGPEDKDLAARLIRFVGRPASYAHALLAVIPTPDSLKVRGYRRSLSKREMHEDGMRVFSENERKGLVVANKDIEWGCLHAVEGVAVC